MAGEHAAPTDVVEERWLTTGVAGIGTASLLADLGHEVPTSLLPSFLTSTLGAPAAALGLIEGLADGLAGVGRLAGGALADDPERRRTTALGGYTATAVLSGLIGVTTAVWQVGVLRAGGWFARGLRVPARNALLADVVHPSAYGRAYGFERAMDNLGAIGGPLLALALVAVFSVRTTILLSIIPGLLASAAILIAIRATPRPALRERQPIRLRIRPVIDRRSAPLVLALGVVAFLVAYVGLAFTAASVAVLLAFFVAAGVGIGLVETAQHSAVAALAPADIRGSAFGLLAAVQSFGNLAASAIAGGIWTLVSARAAFLYLAAWMTIAALALVRSSLT